MSRSADQKIYQTFEEFEREERESYFDSGYEIIDEAFAGELNFDGAGSRSSKRDDADDEE